MNIIELLKDKSLKGIERRQAVVNMIVAGELSVDYMAAIASTIGEKQVATVLEAIEEVSNKQLRPLEAAWLQWAEQYLSSENNSCRREASRIVGNMAAQYPDLLDYAIEHLMRNTSDEGTVIRWAAAYALSRIVILDRYAKSDLYNRLITVCDREEDNGVKNQYLKAIKKARTFLPKISEACAMLKGAPPSTQTWAMPSATITI